MNILVQIITWINVLTNALGQFLLTTPIAGLSGWLSNTIISVILGPLFLLFFKYISNQTAIERARDDMKAHMLALKLFKDSFSVTLRAPLGLFHGALRLLFHSIRPLLIMLIPVSLLLVQMGLWYQYRPLTPGQYSVVTMTLNGNSESPWPTVTLKPTPAVQITTGPVRIFSQRQICWEIKARQNTSEPLIFQVDDQEVEKELAIGDGFMRISENRPSWKFKDIFWHPAEKPFTSASAVQSISMVYPQRISWTSGTDYWVIYFFIVSLISALIFKPILKVKI